MEFIKEMFSDLWSFGLCGKVAALLMAGCMAVLGFFIFILIDMCGYDHQERVEVVGTDYTAPYTTMVTVSNGKTTTMVPQYVPEAFYTLARWGGDVYRCDSNQYWYTKVNDGAVELRAVGYFTSGLITSNEYCNGVELELK